MERSKKRKAQGMPAEKANLPSSILIGGGTGLAVTLLLVLLMPLVLLKTGDPNSLALIAAAVSVFAGSAAGSFIAATRFKDSPITAGMLSCTVIMIPIVLISFFIPGSLNIVNALILIGTLALAAFLGAFAVSKLSSNRKRNMKKALKRR